VVRRQGLRACCACARNPATVATRGSSVYRGGSHYAALIDDRGSTSQLGEAAARDLASAGQRDAPIEIVDYDPAWPARFADELDRLTPLLPDAEIHHFGSTAVPGLAAKPIIDIIALVSDLDEPIEALVKRAGYRYPPAYNATLHRQRWLCRPSAEHRTHHLHLTLDRDLVARRLRFRDRLRDDAELREQYAALKRDLAARNHDDRTIYTAAKSSFIERHSA
jgi:GrpB-like predicted nucleotidyltransferase (UPF0157 family)